MKVILRADLAKVGKRGDICEVSEGFARNFLLPKGLAFTATPGSQAQAVAMRRRRDLRDASDRAAAEVIARDLVPRVFTVPAKSGKDGRLFGSVTAADVVAAVTAQASVDLDRKKLHFDPIKALGTHQVPVKLHSDVEFPLTIEVVAS